MRQWHRRLSLFVAVFMFFIAVTGVLLQGEMMLDGRPPGAPPGAPPGPAAPALSDAELQALFTRVLVSTRHHSDDAVLLGIELRLGGAPTATVVVSEPGGMRKLRLDARSGEPLDAETGNGRRDLHGILLDLHRGAVIGSTGLWISLAAGAVLAVLSVTGLCIYMQTWWRRRKAGQGALLW